MSAASPQRNTQVSGVASLAPSELRLVAPAEGIASPSLVAPHEKQSPAFELKFLISTAVAAEVQSWAERNLQADAFANSDLDGAYQTTTLYLDTANFDVLARSPGYRTRKYRIRRYSLEPQLFLERKTRRGDRVGKQRSGLHAADLPCLLSSHSRPEFAGCWFREETVSRLLAPACLITYLRTAFVALGPHGAMRLTLDRQIRGVPIRDWQIEPVQYGHEILPGEVICELKFRQSLPSLFKQFLVDLQLQPANVSKFRRVMAAASGLDEHHTGLGQG